MNIYLYELKAYRKSIVIWSCSMAALAVLYIFIFKGMGSEIENFKSILNSFPDIAKKALSIYTDSLSTLEGFYSFVFVYIVLCGAIQAMNLGLSILSKEVREKTADFLLTKPVSRRDIMTSKLLAALSSLLITNIVYLAITIPCALIVNIKFDFVIFMMVSVTLLFVQLIFMALGVIISVLSGKIKAVISISLSTVFGFFILNMFGSIIGEDAIRYISPFKYFDLAYIVKNGSYEARYLVIGGIFIAIAIIASYAVYNKKDIHAV